MPVAERFTEGAPCWLDIVVKDADTREHLMSFLEDAFGWTFEVGAPELGYYSVASLGGQPVLAVGQMPEGGGQWVTYFNTADIDAATARATDVGATVVLAPDDVPGQGRLALLVDPAGALHGMWQGTGFPGFGVYGEPGAPCWFDGMSSDADASVDYYSRVFGLHAQRMNGGAMMQSEGEDLSVCSVTQAPQAGMPSAWMPVIGTADLAAIEARLVSLGATIQASGMDVPGGTATAFTDPVVGRGLIVFQPSSWDAFQS